MSSSIVGTDIGSDCCNVSVLAMFYILSCYDIEMIWQGLFYDF